MEEYKEYEIWSETYTVTGTQGAYLHGKVESSNFKNACVQLSRIDNDFYSYFNSFDRTFFGCRLFDNAEEAKEFKGEAKESSV